MQNQKYGLLMINHQVNLPDFSLWDETTNHKANSCSRKLLKLYRSYFYEPTKSENGCWSSSLALRSKCHHQVMYSKINLQKEDCPPYIHELWDCNKAQFDLINKGIKNFVWNKLFSDQDIHNQENLFNTTILNIFQYFMPNKVNSVK